MFNSLFLFYFYLYMLVVHIFDWRNQGRMARIGWVLFELDFISSWFDGFLSRLLQNFEIAFTFSRCELCRLCNALLVILDSCLNVWGIKIIKEFFFFFFWVPVLRKLLIYQLETGGWTDSDMSTQQRVQRKCPSFTKQSNISILDSCLNVWGIRNIKEFFNF